MNGELAQVSGIVMSARKALRNGTDIDFVPDKYVLSVKFIFIPRKRIFKKPIECNSVSDWYDICKKYNIQDVKLIVPTSVNDRYILGYSNTTKSSVVCFWENGNVTYFVPEWEFDKNNQGWNVVYREYISENVPDRKPSFENKSEEFRRVLSDIEKLAININFKGYADIFHSAYEAVEGCSVGGDINIPTYVPDELKGIYYAVSKADVFGAMGSWNDSPPYYAKEKGLEKEYDELSDELLKQLRYNLLYIANECWS